MTTANVTCPPARTLPYWPWVSLVALVAAGAVLRLAALGQESFWSDEYFTIRTAGQPTWRDLLHTVLTIEPHPPLYFFLMHAWIGLFGSSDAVLRLPSALAGIARPAAHVPGLRWLVPERPLVPGSRDRAFRRLADDIYYSQEARSLHVPNLLRSGRPPPRWPGVWGRSAAAPGVDAAGRCWGVVLAFCPILFGVRLADGAADLRFSRAPRSPARPFDRDRRAPAGRRRASRRQRVVRAHGHWGEDTPFLPKAYGPGCSTTPARAQLIGPWYSPFAAEGAVWSWIDVAVIAAGVGLVLLAALEAAQGSRRRVDPRPGRLLHVRRSGGRLVRQADRFWGRATW